ncbi:uncharacterized protein EV420DRAFT_1523990 [Desarmillaria tabescens]|uniref:Uncharacterized protein n=1 Tax=Armillaria tabescens TaxID=1929756 RepID=A0AA39NB07_ARMTA|nr:uncharacterized protein EV420DRAFT_1523990 [Desarmillaria tabescens]KAK0462306.1 hypothetical protein EV420DRAFT_1523990 [Desarmillaria tabescens]
MDHHREERADLLTPSWSSEDQSFSTPAKSETDLSSSSATLAESPPTAQRIQLRGTPAVIAVLLLGAALTAGMHHVYLFILQGRTVSSQFWIKNSSNALSTLVQWLCIASVSVSLTQLIWWLIRRRPFTILQLNHLFGLPSPFPILRLASSKRLRNVIPVIFMATIVQLLALVSILAPNSLEVGSASPKNTTISVPTISFSKSDNISEVRCDFTPSTAWQRILIQALSSDTLVGWNAPIGCGRECHYTIQYPAPALRCTELSPGEVSTMLPEIPGDIESWTVYNATYDLMDTTTGSNMSMAWRTYDADGKSTFAGAHCTLYNSTQQSAVSFVNNTGTVSPSIISYGSLTKYSDESIVSPHVCGFGQDSNVPPQAEIASLLRYTAIVYWLYIQLQGTITLSFLPTSEKPLEHWFPVTDMMSTNLFSLDETARTFTPNAENVISALEQILVNATVALISSTGDTTVTNASVTEDQLIWVYHSQRLWIIYAATLISTAACGAVGLACTLKDGDDSNTTFWDIVRATRNSELDALVEEENDGNAGKDTMLQYAMKGRASDTNNSGVFVLSRSRREGSSWMDMRS